MFKKILVFSGLLFACLLPAAAQKIQLSLEGGLQHSLIPDYTEKAEVQSCPPDAGSGYCRSTSAVEVDHTYKEKPGGYLKSILSYSVSDRVQLYHNLNVNLLRFKASATMKDFSTIDTLESPMFSCRDEQGNLVACEEPEPVTFVGSPDERIGQTSILYLTQEMGVRYKVVPRLWVYGGVDISYRLYSQVYVPTISFTYTPVEEEGEPSRWGAGGGGTLGDITYGTAKDTSGRGLNNLLLGVQAGVAYALTDKFALSAAFQHNLSPAYEANNTASQKARANLFRLGVQYTLKGW